MVEQNLTFQKKYLQEKKIEWLEYLVYFLKNIFQRSFKILLEYLRRISHSAIENKTKQNKKKQNKTIQKSKKPKKPNGL